MTHNRLAQHLILRSWSMAWLAPRHTWDVISAYRNILIELHLDKVVLISFLRNLCKLHPRGATLHKTCEDLGAER